MQKYLFFYIILITVFSCKIEPEKFPIIPSLTFKSMTVDENNNGKFANITLKYTDGDGDIGLNPNDTLPPFNFESKYFYNLFIDVLEIKNGIEKNILIPTTTDTLRYNNRIENITPTGKYKSISGELNLKLNPVLPGTDPDTVFFRIKIIDRQLNESQWVTTPIVVVN